MATSDSGGIATGERLGDVARNASSKYCSSASTIAARAWHTSRPDAPARCRIFRRWLSTLRYVLYRPSSCDGFRFGGSVSRDFALARIFSSSVGIRGHPNRSPPEFK